MYEYSWRNILYLRETTQALYVLCVTSFISDSIFRLMQHETDIYDYENSRSRTKRDFSFSCAHEIFQMIFFFYELLVL